MRDDSGLDSSVGDRKEWRLKEKIKDVESTKSESDLVPGDDNLEKTGKAEAESQVSKWWCHWLRWGRCELRGRGQEPRHPGSEAALLIMMYSGGPVLVPHRAQDWATE